MPGWVIDKENLNSEYGANGTISETLADLPYDFYNGSTVVYHNEIHILGGSDNETKHYKWDGTRWVNVGTLPFNFESGVAVVWNDEIHIIGGLDDQSGYSSRHYKWDGSDWTFVSNLPNMYYAVRSSAVVYNNEIHIMGSSMDISGVITASKYHYRWTGTGWLSVSTLPFKLNAGNAVVINNEIHIMGGEGDDSAYNKHYKWNGSSWSSVSTLPNATRGGASACVVGSDIHLIGNGQGSKYHYKWNGSSWSSVSTLPYKFYYGCSVCHNGLLFILGNHSYYESGYSKKIYVYSNSSWGNSYSIDVGTIPYDFEEGCAVVLNNEIHILGSSTSNNGTKHYKLTDNGWVYVSTLPYTFYQGCAVVLNNEIHILGGYNNNRLHYKWNGSSWSSVSTLPYEFYYGSAIVYNNEIHILGGRYNGTKHYKYSSGSWVNVDTIPYSFERGYAVIFNGEIHILGSYDNGTNHYKWDGSSWSSVSTLPFETFSASAEVLNGEIHILGSRVPGNKTKHSKWNGTSWSPITAIPYDFYFGSIALLGNKLYLLGSIDYPTRNYYYLESASFYKIMDAWTKEVRPNDMMPLYETNVQGTFEYAILNHPGETFFIIFDGPGYGSGELAYMWDEVVGDDEVITHVEERTWEEGTAGHHIYPSLPQSGYYFDSIPGEGINGRVGISINIWGSGPCKVSVYLGKTTTPTLPKYVYKMKNVIRAWIGNAMNVAKRVLMKMPFASAVTDSNPSAITLTGSGIGIDIDKESSIFDFGNELWGNSIKKVYKFTNGSWVQQTNYTISNSEGNSEFAYHFLEAIDGKLHRIYYDHRAQGQAVVEYHTINHFVIASGETSWTLLRTFFEEPVAYDTAYKAMLGVVEFKNEIHIILGSYFKNMGRHYKWDSTNNNWIRLNNSSLPNFDPTAVSTDPDVYTFVRDFLVVYQNRLYAFYMEKTGSTSFDIKCCVYNESNDTWDTAITCIHEENQSSYTYGEYTKVIPFKGLILIFGRSNDYIGDPVSNTWIKLDYEEAYSNEIVEGRGHQTCISTVNDELHILRDKSQATLHEKLKLYFAQPSELDG